MLNGIAAQLERVRQFELLQETGAMGLDRLVRNPHREEREELLFHRIMTQPAEPIRIMLHRLHQ